MRIDFHAHILPGMDHGCENVDVSLRQLELAAVNNVDVIVATSHFYPHIHTAEGYAEQRAEAHNILREAAGGREGLPKVLPGAEVLIYNNLDRMQGIEKLCIEGTDVMLLEFPLSRVWERGLIETAVRMKKEMGIRVVLAHADRYAYDAVMALADEGIELQLNTDSICSIMKYSLCRKYLATGMVVALGSDIHGVSKAYRNYSKAIKKLGDSAAEISDRTQDMLKACISSI